MEKGPGCVCLKEGYLSLPTPSSQRKPFDREEEEGSFAQGLVVSGSLGEKNSSHQGRQEVEKRAPQVIVPRRFQFSHAPAKPHVTMHCGTACGGSWLLSVLRWSLWSGVLL